MYNEHTDVIARFPGGRSGVLPLRLAIREGALDVEPVNCDWRWPVDGRSAAELAGIMDADIAERAEQQRRDDADRAWAAHCRAVAYFREADLRSDIAMNAAADRGAAAAFHSRW